MLEISKPEKQRVTATEDTCGEAHRYQSLTWEGVMASQFSRRDFNRLLAVTAFTSVSGTGSIVRNPAYAAAARAVLATFGSVPIPQTYAKAISAFEKRLGNDVTVEHVSVSSGAQVVTSVAGGSIDISPIGSSPMVVGYANGIPLSMIYVQSEVIDHEGLAVREKSGIRRLEDLRGKKIGLPFNTSAHFGILAALNTVGMTAADLTLFNMKADAIAAAWSRDDIDGTYIWNPILSGVVSNGGVLIFKTGDLQKHGIVVFDAIVARNDFSMKHPDVVLAYLNEINRIGQLFIDNPQSVVKAMTPYLGIPADAIAAFIKGYHRVSPSDMITERWMGAPGAKNTGVLKTVASQAQFLKSAGQLNAVPADFSRLVNSSFLAKMV
jgi:taurine transport system substrate-binding protein